MQKILKWAGMIIGGLVAVIVIMAGVLYMMGGSKLHAAVSIPSESLMVSADSAAIAQGGYLAAINGCQDCHGKNLGGSVFIDAPPFLIVASNLTPGEGGVGGQYSDADWERAIRHGVRPGGQGLAPMMPAAAYNGMGNDEMAALIAYLKTVPPVDNVLPATEFRPLGRIIAGTGGLYTANIPVDHEKAHLAKAPAHGATLEYGAYRAENLCGYCHGESLSGGEPTEPGAPIPPALTEVDEWGLGAFVHAMRTGQRPDGTIMDPEQMPWTATANMTDAELEAIYKYIGSL